MIPKNTKLQKGISALEIIITVAILVLVGSIVLNSFLSSRNVPNLTTSAQNVISVLRLAQSKSLAGENNSEWGVRLTQFQYTLFRGPTFGGGTPIETFSLPSSIEISNINLAGGSIDVIFQRISGTTTHSGTFDIRTPAGANSFSITVAPSGKIYQTTLAPLAVGRSFDARHRSFNLGWSIQGQTSLTLTFSDPPNPDTIQTITPLTTYFNAGQSKFDWSGTITIGGQDQILRIHTTLLNPSNTVLSIDRDCRKNTKQVKITFGTSDIATYMANCLDVVIGPFGGGMIEL